MEDLASVEVSQCAGPAVICWLLWWVQIDTVHNLLSDKFTLEEIWVKGVEVVPSCMLSFSMHQTPTQCTMQRRVCDSAAAADA